MKLLTILLVLFAFTGIASAADVTNVITDVQPNCVGGDDVITPHHHYNDTWFGLSNEGHITYNIYMYGYTGNHDPLYKDAFIGTINPGQIMMVNSNASYKIYAGYDEIRDTAVLEVVEKKFNQWWVIILIIIILLIALIRIYKVIK